MKKLLLFLCLFLGLPAFGQTILTVTTLSSAVDGTSGATINNPKVKTIVVASATGISAPSASDTTKHTFLYVDREAMDVQSITSTTVTVIRGVQGTQAVPHASSAVVWVIPAYLALYTGGGVDTGPAVPAGACSRSAQLVLPRIQFVTGLVTDCIGGQWVNGDARQNTRTLNSLLRSPDPGGTAYTALETNGTAASAATEIYCSEIELPYSMLLTGMAVLNGTTVGTNKHFYILYDSTGNVLANTAVAGVTTAGASTYQKINFVTKYYAVGPARYFACDGLNGTTDTIRHTATSTNDNILGGAVTAQVFGTAAAITVPTTFTTVKAPYFAIF